VNIGQKIGAAMVSVTLAICMVFGGGALPATAASGYPTLKGTSALHTPPVVQVASGNYYTLYQTSTVYQVKRVLIPANNCLRFWNSTSSITRCAGSTSVWHNFSALRIAPTYFVANVY
jgi:hypothetical protein